MQLILDPDNGINFNPKMAALDAESISEKTNTNGLIQKLNDNKENLENMYDKENNKSDAITFESSELTDEIDVKINSINSDLTNTETVRVEGEEIINSKLENINDTVKNVETKETENCNLNLDVKGLQIPTKSPKELKTSELWNEIEKCLKTKDTFPLDITKNEEITRKEQKELLETISDIKLQSSEFINDIQECLKNNDNNPTTLFKNDDEDIAHNKADIIQDQIKNTDHVVTDGVENEKTVTVENEETNYSEQNLVLNKNTEKSDKMDVDELVQHSPKESNSEIDIKNNVETLVETDESGIISTSPKVNTVESNVIKETILEPMSVDQKQENDIENKLKDTKQESIALKENCQVKEITDIETQEEIAQELDRNENSVTVKDLADTIVVPNIASEDTENCPVKEITDSENRVEVAQELERNDDILTVKDFADTNIVPNIAGKDTENSPVKETKDSEKREEKSQQLERNEDPVTVEDLADKIIVPNIASEDTEAVELLTDNSSQLENSNEKNEKGSLSENIAQEELDTFNMKQDGEAKNLSNQSSVEEVKSSLLLNELKKPLISKLSNNLDILSDDEDDTSRPKDPSPLPPPSEVKCINLDDDDDCMLIDEDSSASESKPQEPAIENKTEDNNIELEKCENKLAEKPVEDAKSDTKVADAYIETPSSEEITPKVSEKQPEETVEDKKDKPLVPKDFLKLCKKKLCDMTRDDLEEFCVLKIAEAVIDRNHLYDMKAKIKTMYQNIEEFKKKAGVLAKQNRDLQVVLKSVQEEQKKKTNTPITPLKITRSVGMQVVMVDKPVRRKIGRGQITVNNVAPSIPLKATRNNVNVQKNQNNRQSSANTSSATNNQQIPVPRLVPAQNTAKIVTIPTYQKATPNNVPNGARKSPSIVQKAEKRPLSRQSSTSSVTVDLTDDEPPAKTRPAQPPVRLVNQQSLMAPRIPNSPQAVNSPRKVFIPISSTQADGLRVGQKIMLRGVKPPDQNALIPQQLRTPSPKVVRLPTNSVRLPRVNNSRHPAPLPDPVKQYQPPTWKGLPPAPDLKLSKVENGIVISWKIDGYLEDKCEKIASYQLYAYQETTGPPSTSLWKKIGDVKALPLPMACTLTQFMAGYKYYFAVRAVDVRSRVGPFSLPGSILLLNKV